MDDNINSQAPGSQDQPQPQPQSTPPFPQTEQSTAQTPPVPADESNQDAKMWAMFCHLGGLAMFLSVPFPFASVIVPLILWLIKKDDFPFVDEQGKEALNFQISIAIGILVCIPLCFIIIGAFLLPALMIFNLVMIIIASIESNKGKHYHYPFSLRLVK